MNTNTQIPSELPEDRILWQSPDSAVIIRRRVKTAMRWPQHAAPIITMDLQVREGTRIRSLGNGRIDVCLEHAAQVALIRALNEADPKVHYGVPEHFPQKPLPRKEYFDRLNAARWARKRGKI